MAKNNRIIIVGSSSFEDRACLFGILDQLRNVWEMAGMGDIERVYSGSFSGAAEFAKEWAKLNAIEYHEHDFFHTEKNNPLFDTIDVPDFVLKEDPFYQKGSDFLMSEQISMMITIPDMNGEVGVETKNLMRMASLIKLDVLEGHLFYQQVLNIRNAEQKKAVTKLSSLDKF